MRLANAFLQGDFPKDYHIPAYDRAAMVRRTREKPRWVHFGAGNIFRAFLAVLADRMLEEGRADTGIVLCETFDPELVEKAYLPYNNVGLSVTLGADGTVTKRVVGSVAEATADDARMRELFCMPSVQLVSLTITEKGYLLRDSTGMLLPSVRRDMETFPQSPEHLMSKLARLLLARYEVGAAPIALVSMDNFFHNGGQLRRAVLEVAQAWVDAGSVQACLLDYLADPQRVAFPCSMIDKITPRPDATVQTLLEREGLQDTQCFVTARGTYAAPFVNAEQTEYLVVEDSFPNGRPPLETVGVYMADKQTVEKAERMKVCTCLNPLHTALAIFGCLVGHSTISSEMGDPQLARLVERLGREEGMPVAADPMVLSPQQFLWDVLNLRLPNPFMPDTPQRIACDTSQKIPVRFGETLKAYGGECHRLTIIPLVLAGWLRYLLAVDDQGRPFDLSPDPMLPRLQEVMKPFTLGQTESLDCLDSLLADSGIFGVNLLEAGLGNRVKALFGEMSKAPGAVRATLIASVGI